MDALRGRIDAAIDARRETTAQLDPREGPFALFITLFVHHTRKFERRTTPFEARDDQFHCEACNTAFDTREALLAHIDNITSAAVLSQVADRAQAQARRLHDEEWPKQRRLPSTDLRLLLSALARVDRVA
eukprot:gnl/Chilomastix_cuspidata/4335.p5 GENE.gnl/Chilomastix_cuspidata/4335~~gnl/Chilomastix_cuspidata/4335.p5  ORF type:complete len:130 (-),score=5.33 gnl/Chilomastix_cuspidata/4335:1678-2067(-)